MDGPLTVTFFRVEHNDGFSMPRISLHNRRAGRAYPRMVHWVCQRHLEIILFGRTDGGSSGPIWKILNASGLGSTALNCSRKTVDDETITIEEFQQIMGAFRSMLPDACDPSSAGRIRSCTLLPVATAALVCRQHGRSQASTAWLHAFSQVVPDSWTLHEEADRNAANGEVDLLLQDQLDDQSFEVEDVSFRDELMSMPAFQAVSDDEERLKTYILQRVPPVLKKELDNFIAYRTATFAARRQGGAVQSISAETDRTHLLRFIGYLERTNHLPAGQLLNLTLMIRSDLGDLVSAYASWLQNTQRCRFSSVANYINGLISITSYCYANLEPTDAVLNMDPNPLAQLINLRGQAEKASNTQQMYDKRVGGWLEWDDVQKARVAAIESLAEVTGGRAAYRSALRDATALSLLSLIPPDRVGCIRKLRFGHTLKKKADGGWMMDLSKQRDGHKTSRFYGPFAASLPSELTQILDKYERLFSFEPDGDSAYLFHPPQSNFDRPMESSAWTGWVKRLFKRHHGEEIAPKTLRSVFITWLRDHTAAPEVLKSAAHAMKHSEARQASADYDQESDDRLVKAAYDFNLSFAASFHADVPAVGSSAAHASTSEAPNLHPSPRPTRPGKEVGMAAARSMARSGLTAAPVASAAAPEPMEEDEGSRSGLVDDEWLPLEGGPFVARLMTKSRQPVESARYRNYAVMLPLDPVVTPLFPGGQVRFPVVAGAEDGVVCQLPRSWDSSTRCLILRLKLDKAGATETELTIASALFRKPFIEPEDDADDDLLAHEPPLDTDWGADGIVPLAQVPAAALEEAAAALAAPATLTDEADRDAADAQSEPGAMDPSPGVPVPPPPAPRSSVRPRKRKERYGDNGELDGAARSFRSAAPARKKSVSLEDETGVPDFAFPANELWAKGWHAGRHAWFKAHVVKLRTKFPRIHVAFDEDEAGNTHALALPELSAYVHAADVRPRDW